jgi:hypothetical protein
MNSYRPPLLRDVPGVKPFAITDAAVAAAVSQCWLHRAAGMPLSVKFNHEVCDWCTYPLDVLLNSLNDFWRDEDTEYRERDFRALPKAVQRRLVESAAKEDAYGLTTDESRPTPGSSSEMSR